MEKKYHNVDLQSRGGFAGTVGGRGGDHFSGYRNVSRRSCQQNNYKPHQTIPFAIDFQQVKRQYLPFE